MKLESASLILNAMIATLLGRIVSLSGENASMFHCESVVWSRIIYCTALLSGRQTLIDGSRSPFLFSLVFFVPFASSGANVFWTSVDSFTDFAPFRSGTV